MADDAVLLVAEFDGCHFEIQEVCGDGYYVWRFVGASTIVTNDYLQDDIALEKRRALEEWGVPKCLGSSIRVESFAYPEPRLTSQGLDAASLG